MPANERRQWLTSVEFVLSDREMRRVHSRPFHVLRVSREPGVPALHGCRMNRFHIPIDTSFCIPAGSRDVD